MQIYYDVNDVPKNDATILTLGTFDGIHFGHQQIIKELVQEAKASNSRSFLITFEPHPRKIVQKGSEVKLLTTLKEKIEVLKTFGIDNLLVINFTREFASLTSEEFISNYLLEKIGIKEIIIGHDHQFGKDRSGSIETFEKFSKTFNFKVKDLPPFKVGEVVVSSTKVREKLLEGSIKEANEFLNRNYSFEGLVVEGDKRGRSLGFPTANIKVDSDKVIPSTGIYAIRVTENGNTHNGVMSIGTRPTFYNEGELTIEIFIFDFNSNIYNDNIKVEVIDKIREETKFDSAEDLIKQMHSDTEEAKKRLQNF